MANDSTKQLNNTPLGKQRDSKGRLLPGNTIGNRFERGKSGNPKGRDPKESCLTSLYKEQLATVGGKGGLTKEQVIATKAVNYLVEYGVDSTWLKLLELIQERIEGKVTLPITGGGEIELHVKYDR